MFPVVRNPNPVSTGRNYAANFLSNKALFIRDIDFWQSLPKYCRERAIESSIGFSKASIRQKASDQTLSKFNTWAQKYFVGEKISCIISTIEHRIRILHPQISSIKVCRKSVTRPKSAFVSRKIQCIILTI